jgi:NADH-quinone oxidoreductase subunit G
MVINAAADIAIALSKKGKKPSLSVVFPECNSLGLSLMNGNSLDDLTELAGKKGFDTVIVLENDLFSVNDKNKTEVLLNNFKTVIVLGCLMNDMSGRADIVLPSGTFAESTGTIVNNEGRAQRYYRVLPETGPVRDSWKHIAWIMEVSGKSNDQQQVTFDDISRSLASKYKIFTKIREIMPDSSFRIYNEKIARQTLRFSGRTAMNADVDVSEPEPPRDDDSPLAYSMEGFKGVPSSWLVPWYWSPGWNSVQAMNKYMDEPGGDAEGGNQGVLLFE